MTSFTLKVIAYRPYVYPSVCFTILVNFIGSREKYGYEQKLARSGKHIVSVCPYLQTIYHSSSPLVITTQ